MCGRDRAKGDIPLALRRNVVIQPELAVDLLETVMNGVVVELGLGDTLGVNGRGETWDFTLGSVAPAATLFARSIRID
jgi:hypothetical protein